MTPRACVHCGNTAGPFVRTAGGLECEDQPCIPPAEEPK